MDVFCAAEIEKSENMWIIHPKPYMSDGTNRTRMTNWDNNLETCRSDCFLHERSSEGP